MNKVVEIGPFSTISEIGANSNFFSTNSINWTIGLFQEMINLTIPCFTGRTVFLKAILTSFEYVVICCTQKFLTKILGKQLRGDIQFHILSTLILWRKN